MLQHTDANVMLDTMSDEWAFSEINHSKVCIQSWRIVQRSPDAQPLETPHSADSALEGEHFGCQLGVIAVSTWELPIDFSEMWIHAKISSHGAHRSYFLINLVESWVKI